MIRIQTTPKANCPNCFIGSNYCPDCGEKRFMEGDFSLKRFFSGIFEDFTNIDARFFKTIFLLTFRPGFLTNEYSRGVQIHYIKPLRLFVMIALIHFLAFGLSSSIDIYNIHTVHFIDRFGFYDQILKSGLLSGYKPVYTDPDLLNKEIKNTLSVVIYLVIFAIAGFYYILFRHKRQFYTEHLVFIFHIISAAFLRNFLLIPFFFISIPLGVFLALGLNLIYVVTAIRKYYGLKLIRAIMTIAPTLVILGMLVYFTLLLSAVLAVYI
jgi:hypothetical protein